MILTLIHSNFVLGSLASTKLFTISEDPRTGPAPCCSGGPGPHVKSCVGVEVHPEVLRSRGNITVEGLEGEIATLQFSNTIPPRGSVYKVRAFSSQPYLISSTVLSQSSIISILRP